MTVEEKSKEFYHKYRELNLAPESAAFNAALEMAEWLKERMIEKAVEWLEANAGKYIKGSLSTSNYCTEHCIEDFKKVMNEE